MEIGNAAQPHEPGSALRSPRPPLMRSVKQRLRWSIPVTQPLLLCSQVQRSGGTLLARLFDSHPSCFAHPHELKWGKPRKWHWPQLDLSLDADALLARLDEDWPSTFARKGYSKY